MLTDLKTHAFYIIIAIIAAVCFHSWLAEHDARLASDAIVNQKQAVIAQLETDIQTIQSQAQQTITALQKQALAVKTPAQAINAIPSVSPLPLDVRAVPGLPTVVQVDALPLYQELNQCAQDKVARAACEQVNAKQTDELTADAAEIKTLKAKPSFWHRVSSSVKTGSVFISIGIVIAKLAL